MPQLSICDLFNANQERLRLRWITKEQFGARPLALNANDENPIPLVGYLNLIHPNQIQVIGQAEFDYLNKLPANRITSALNDFFPEQCGALALTEHLRLPDPWQSACVELQIPVISSAVAGHVLIEFFENYLNEILGQRTVTHGVMMEVSGVGVLITGESGIGKSELALELITRGHRLIADDCPEFRRISADTIDATCPFAVQDFLEVRGLGVIDVRAMFGNGAVKRNKYLRLIVNLAPLDSLDSGNIDRLSGIRRERKILDVAIPEITLPVMAGRNLAVLLEVAVKDHLLRLNGHQADQLMIQRHEQALQQETY